MSQYRSEGRRPGSEGRRPGNEGRPSGNEGRPSGKFCAWYGGCPQELEARLRQRERSRDVEGLPDPGAPKLSNSRPRWAAGHRTFGAECS